MNKTICLITNWYPTKNNPVSGLFFKEQALAVGDYFNFVVLHIYENRTLLFRETVNLQKENKESNITEFSAYVKRPLYITVVDLISDIFQRRILKKSDNGVGRYTSRCYKKYLYRVLKKVALLLDTDFDALYCIDAQKEAGYLNVLSNITGKPYIVSEHGPFPWPGTVLDDFNKRSIEEANSVFAISKDKIRQMLLQNVKLPKVVYIGNLVDESLLLNNPKHNSKTLLIVASHSFYKNYDMFIDVMNRLTEITDKQYKVLIVGYAANKGYAEDVLDFEKKIKNSKFSEIAELIPEIEHERICNVYNRADVFIMTSIQEGQPVSALEAACCGIPIFSTRCGGVEDYVTDDIGRLYEIDDCEGFAQGLKDFLEGKIVFNPERVRDTVVSKYGREAFTNTFVSAFYEVMKDNDS